MFNKKAKGSQTKQSKRQCGYHLNAGHIILHESARQCWPLCKPPLLKQPMNAPVWDLTQNHVAPCLPLTRDLWPPLTRMLQTLLAPKEPIASHFPSWLWGLMVGDTDAAVTQHPKLLNVHICVNIPSIWIVMFIQSKSIYSTLHHQKSFFQVYFTPVINTTLSRTVEALPPPGLSACHPCSSQS